MKIRKLEIRGITWIDWADLDKKDIFEVVKDYNFHELDIEACFENNQRARVDKYDDYLFLILKFPKYNKQLWIYELNEFNIFLGKNYIITFRDFPAKHIDKLFEKYEKQDLEDNANFRFTSWYILYEIIQTMLEKMFKVLDNNAKDLKNLEKIVFTNSSSSLVKKIMIKKRNIMFLKHMFKPQISVLKLTETHINQMFNWEIEVYFEDLEDKIEYITNYLDIYEENILYIEDAFQTIVDIKTNTVMKILTIFSTLLLPLTLITSFYGMNITLPYQNNPNFVYWLMLFSLISMIIAFIRAVRKRKI